MTMIAAVDLHTHPIEPVRSWLGDVPEEENVRHAEHHVRPVVQGLLQQLHGRVDQHELGYAAKVYIGNKG